MSTLSGRRHPRSPEGISDGGPRIAPLYSTQGLGIKENSMNSIRSLKFASAALLLCLVASVASAQPGRPPAFRGDDRSRRDPGEVLTRGPVHEAFAEAVVLDPE